MMVPILKYQLHQNSNISFIHYPTLHKQNKFKQDFYVQNLRKVMLSNLYHLEKREKISLLILLEVAPGFKRG